MMRLHKILSSSLILGALVFGVSSGFAGKLNEFFKNEGLSDKWTGTTVQPAPVDLFQIDGFPMAPGKTVKNYFPDRDKSKVSHDLLAVSACINKPFGDFLEINAEETDWISKGLSSDLIMDKQGKVARWSPQLKTSKSQMVGPFNNEATSWFVQVDADRKMSDTQINRIIEVHNHYDLPLKAKIVYGDSHYELGLSQDPKQSVENMGHFRNMTELKLLIPESASAATN